MSRDAYFVLDAGLPLTREMVEYRRATGKWPPAQKRPHLPPPPDDVEAAAYEEQEHPRYPKGHPRGGKWAPKSRAEMVESPQFKWWFGDSKVVDVMGRPRVVYHGTSDDFSEFEDGDPSNGFRPDTGLGHFFTTSPSEAEWFTRQYVDSMTRSEENRLRDFAYAANVMPVYLSLQNPKIYETQKDLINAINEVTTDHAPDLRQDLIDQGYDGVVIQSPDMDPEYESTWYVAFSPTQIKSATGNRGTFNPDDPDITATYEEQEHPRYPVGHPRAGQWMDKSDSGLKSKIDEYREAREADISTAFRVAKKAGFKMDGACLEASVVMHEQFISKGHEAELRRYDTPFGGHWTVVLKDELLGDEELDPTIAFWAADRPADAKPKELYRVTDNSPHRSKEWEIDSTASVAEAYATTFGDKEGRERLKRADITARAMPEYEEEKHKRQPKGMPGGGQFAPKPGAEEPLKERRAAEPKPSAHDVSVRVSTKEETRNVGFVSKSKRISGSLKEALNRAFAPDNLKFVDSIRERVVALDPAAHVNALPAVGNWLDGSEESAIAVSDGDAGAFRYAIAQAALEKQQKNAIHFISGRGEDLLYDASFPGKTVDEVTALLDQHGFQFRTLAVGKDSVRAMMVDFGGTMHDAANELGAEAGVPITTVVGRADMLGASEKTVEKGTDAEAREEAATEYRKIIDEYENAAKMGWAANAPMLLDVRTPPPPGKYLEVELLSDPDKGAERSRVGVAAMDVPPPPPIPQLPNLSPDERQAEQESVSMFLKDPDGMTNDLLEGMKDRERFPDGPNVFSTDEAKKLFPAWNPRNGTAEQRLAAHALYNVAVHPVANALAKRAFLKYLDDVVSKLEGDARSVLVTAGGVAAGKGYALKNIEKAKAIMHQVGAVWDSAGEQNSTECKWVYEECKKRGISTHFVYIHADPTKTWENPGQGVVERAEKKGRMVDARLFADSYKHGAINFEAFAKSVKGDKSAEVIYIDNTTATPRIISSMPKVALELDEEQLYARSLKYLLESHVKEHIKRGGSNGIRIWGGPKAQKKTVAAHRADTRKPRSRP